MKQVNPFGGPGNSATTWRSMGRTKVIRVGGYTYPNWTRLYVVKTIITLYMTLVLLSPMIIKLRIMVSFGTASNCVVQAISSLPEYHMVTRFRSSTLLPFLS